MDSPSTCVFSSGNIPSRTNIECKTKKRRGPYHSYRKKKENVIIDDEALISEDICYDNGHFYIDENYDETILPDAFLSSDAESEEDNSDSDAQQDESDDDAVIYPGAKLKLSIAMLLLISFVTRFHLSNECLDQLLGLIALLLPQGNILCKSLYKFRKYFQKYKFPVISHKFCKMCYMIVGEETVCPNAVCSANLSNNSAKAYFLEFPLIPQIVSFFKREEFVTKVQHRFNRLKKCKSNIEDIYDGQQYKKHMDGGLLSHRFNLSLMWNTDGCPVFNSSKFSIWPLFFTINELPYSDRISRDNMLLAGIWFGEMKPVMWCYLNPCFRSLKQLETDGVDVDIVGYGVKNCKVCLVGGTADLPAKALVLNSSQYNASYGCHKCQQRGETVHVSARGIVHAFPFSVCDNKGPARTHDETKIQAQTASENKPVKGVKGPNWFSYLSSYDQIKGCGIDYMHGICIGIVKKLTTFWFSSEHSSDEFSVRKRLKDIDARISCIKPIQEIHRIPRKVSTHLKFWKASEFRTFLLYYSLPVLFGILPRKYLQHLALLSQSTFILLQASISPAELQTAELMLISFVRDFALLYGPRHMGMNVHNLLHLTDSVRELGPLWTHSCFHFEDMNGFILSLIHGTQSIPQQIISAVNTLQSLPLIKQKHLL